MRIWLPMVQKVMKGPQKLFIKKIKMGIKKLNSLRSPGKKQEDMYNN